MNDCGTYLFIDKGEYVYDDDDTGMQQDTNYRTVVINTLFIIVLFVDEDQYPYGDEPGMLLL